MPNSKNDDMDRIGNRNVPQGGTQNNRQGTGGPRSTSQGQGGNFNQGTSQGNETKRDREQGSNMTNLSDQNRGSELYNRDSGKATAATSRDSETRGSDRDTKE